MGELTCLRRLDADALHRHAALAMLLRCGAQARMASVDAVPCLRFELLRQGGSMICRVDANRWAARHYPDLVGLDWMSLPTALLDGLAGGSTPLDLQHPNLAYLHARPMAQADGALSVPLPAVDAAEGLVWIERLEGNLPAAQSACLPDDLRVPLTVTVASTLLGWRRLSRLRQGDILLLPAVASLVSSGRHGLFRGVIDFEKETFTMSNPLPSPASNQLGQNTLEVASVPLQLDICFTEIELTVAELSRLQQGSVLKLPTLAQTRMKLCHNGHCIATGELVQVGDVLGIQLAQAPQLA